MVAAEVVIYVTGYCPYCAKAKALLRSKGADFIEVPVEDREDLRSWLRKSTGQSTVPQIFINNKSIGGYSDMAKLDASGQLDALLAQPKPADLPPLPR